MYEKRKLHTGSEKNPHGFRKSLLGWWQGKRTLADSGYAFAALLRGCEEDRERLGAEVLP